MTAYRWVVSFLDRPNKAGGRRRFYYFRRPGFPIVRIKSEPGTVEFSYIYRSLTELETIAEFEAVRTRLGMQQRRRIDWDRADAFIARAEREVAKRNRSDD
jgi:hypothetical protein